MRQLFITPLTVILAVALAAAAIAGFVLIPAGTLLPVHWGLDLKPDNWQHRELALLIGPAIAVSIGLLLALMRRYGNRGSTDSAARVFRIVFPLILLLALGIESAIVWSGLSMPVPTAA